MKIESGGLLTCGTSADGEKIHLDLSDLAGRPVSLDLPFEQAQAIAMTLPTLLSKALKARTGNSEARYAFPLGHWVVEGTRERPDLILTLRTPDGFEVSFSVPPEACQALGWTLLNEAAGADKPTVTIDGIGDEKPASLN